MKGRAAVLLCAFVLGTPANLATHAVPRPKVREARSHAAAHRPPAPLRPILRWQPLAHRAWPGHSTLVLAVIAQESRGNPTTYVEDPNTTWDCGLMGLNSENWPTYGLNWTTAAIPADNIRAGVGILKRDIREYGKWEGLSVYNSGSPFGAPEYAAEVIRWQATIRRGEEGMR